MSIHPPTPTTGRARPQRWITALALYVCIGGVLSLLGWTIDRPWLTDWSGAGISIQPNAAVCALVTGLSLLAISFGLGWGGAVLGACVAALAVATIAQYPTGADFGIDTLLMFGRGWGRTSVLTPGRMGPMGAASWTLLGVSLVLLSLGAPRSGVRRAASTLACVVCGLSSLSLIGYLYGADTLYALPRVTAIALQTSTFLLAGGVAALFSVPEHGLPSVLSRSDAAGMIVRRTLLPIVIVPLVLGWLRLLGERDGYYDSGFGLAALVLGVIALLLGLLWWLARDITRLEDTRRNAEVALHATRAELLLITEATPLLLIRCSRDLRYQFVNRAAAALFGLSPQEVIGRPLLELLGEEGLAVLRPSIDRVLRGEHLEFEVEMPYRALGRRWMRMNYTPDRNDDGEVVGWIASIIDTTDRRRAEERLRESEALLATELAATQRAEEALRESDRRKDEFLATLAHELRNPLAPIASAAQLLRLNTSGESRLTAVHDIMDRQLRHLVRLVDDLLEVSRISRGRIELQKQPVDVASILAQAIDIVRSLIDDFGHTLTVDVPPEPIVLHADPVRLTQVFANLLNNACRYTPPGGQIVVTIRRADGEAIVAVKDTGAGIPAAMRERVFGLFTQVDRPLERTTGGLGIGLYLVKRIVDLHDGTVDVRSAGEGSGSEFVVHLPITSAPLIESPPPADIAAPPSAPSARPQRILIVDDNRDAVESLTLLLAQLGHETQTAWDGHDAVKKASGWQPHVILLDIGLPGMNGFDACRAIRQLPGGTSIRVIALTGWGQREDRLRSQAAGFDEHLVKPVDFALLERMLSDAPTIRV